MVNIKEQSLASIASENHQLVPILEKYHLDFCCGGKKTLAAACTEKGLGVDDIIKELEATSLRATQSTMQFTDMNAEQLIRHILVYHHHYTRQTMPVIENHLQKVAAKHGDSFPYMKTVLELFSELKNDMHEHMQKEEIVLFPRIKEIKAAFDNREQNKMQHSYISNPIAAMEHEHDQAGTLMEQIRILTNDYTAPEQACNTFRLVMEELKAFEEDLHKHVHLENNILFPLAVSMMGEQKN